LDAVVLKTPVLRPILPPLLMAMEQPTITLVMTMQRAMLTRPAMLMPQRTMLPTMQRLNSRLTSDRLQLLKKCERPFPSMETAAFVVGDHDSLRGGHRHGGVFRRSTRRSPPDSS
jgi:hypothetical protein